jgi:hypothetical protein
MIKIIRGLGIGIHIEPRDAEDHMRYHCIPVFPNFLLYTADVAATFPMTLGGHGDDDGDLKLLGADFCFPGAGGRINE